jgi:hypothetical protein
VFLVVLVGVGVIKEVGDLSAGTYHSGQPGGAKIGQMVETGGTGQIMLIFGFLGLILSFGIGSIASGVWLIVYGKSNNNLIAILLVLWVVFITTVYFAEYLR